ncbi:MAG: glycogen synthase GlgA [Clostridiaceae bacterium]|nr:glycogen synthase GlgA [Clostridiaceae bacterium]
MKILFVSAEMSPFAKTGGLADVAGSLPKALNGLGHDVRVVMPRYRMIKGNLKYVTDFPVWIDQSIETCIIRQTEVPFVWKDRTNHLTVYFTDSYRLFDREGIYGHFDDAERFVFFCKAVLEMLPCINFKPDVIHCNDWHTGPVCLLLKEKYRDDNYFKDIATLFTIHNLEYQGHFSSHVIKLLNCDYSIFTPEKTEFYGMFNFMKAGLVYADIINTVSRVYAEEIKTPEYGERLEGVLQKRASDLFGIVNGIDYEQFDPLTDKNIVQNYSADNPEDKKMNKTALQKEMGLPCADVPLIGLISRLPGQKGLNLIIDCIDDMLARDIQFVLLGTGDEYYHEQFRAIASRYPGKIAVNLEFNPKLAQMIYAGSDMFLMPSRFEPCGLGQIISLRYGTVPIVRATGGLAETIIDYDADNENGNGFSFSEFSSDAMLDAIDRAVRVYKNRPEEWKTLIKRAMKIDFSWDSSAKKYEELYKHTIEKRKKDDSEGKN